jgi:hypothetical protein
MNEPNRDRPVTFVKSIASLLVFEQRFESSSSGEIHPSLCHINPQGISLESI